MALRALCLVLTGLLATPLAAAQTPAPSAPEAGLETPDPAEAADAPAEAPVPAAVVEATTAWTEAWKDKPRLLSLVGSTEGVDDPDEALRARLTLLGEKTFSNREWRSYWEAQGRTAAALASALRDANTAEEQATTLDAWVALAGDKVANQDRYFEAIQSERDAVEERLEVSLETKTEPEPSVPLPSDPNPYELRRFEVEDLERRIDAQEVRRSSVVAEIAFIERQGASEAILAEALARDVELARQEVSIARDGATLAGDWGTLWSGVVTATASKVEQLQSESDYGAARKRSSDVELGLAKSQLKFRNTRLDELRDRLEDAGSWQTWTAATRDTVTQWLRERAWRILIGLVLIAFAVRLSLRGVSYGVALVLDRADDNPDVNDDGDQRRQTLADVFRSVARIAIYIVAGLLALEQVGINTGPLLGSVAILGLAVSFGSQNLVRDVVNGFFILLENQYAVGDVVSINGKSGGIERITIRSTWVRSASGDLHVIPNGSISLVSNMTRSWSRAICDIGIGYGANLDVVQAVVEQVGAELHADPEWQPHLAEVPQWVGVTEQADSAVIVRTQVKVLPGQQWGVKRELFRRLKLALEAAEVEIPFPQMVVHQASPETGAS